MLKTLLFIAALSAPQSQGSELDLTNARETLGALGPMRPAGKYLPGDVYHLAFDIQNVQVTERGEAQYSMAMEVKDSGNKVIFSQQPDDRKALNVFGGRTLPATAHVIIGNDQPAGKYNLKVTVTDRTSKKSKVLTREIEVAPLNFGMVRVNISADPDQRVPAPTVGVPGQAMWVHLWAVGFKRGGAKNEPDVNFEMTVLDEKNQPTLAKPLTDEFKVLPKDTFAVPVSFPLIPNRAGKFTIKMKATDRIANKTSELSFPVVVIEAK